MKSVKWIGFLAAAVALSGPAGAADTLGVPAVSGDQVVSVYDARSGRVTFLSLSNPADESIFLDIALYAEDLSSVLAEKTVSLLPAANLVVDPTNFGGGGANGSAGLAVVTSVKAIDDLTPVVPPEPIVGSFTLANLNLMTGFGQNPMGRFAIDVGSGDRASPGTEVDGVEVAYERFDPEILMVPVYFNPADLGPAADDGNRVLLVGFTDDYGDGAFGVGPASVDVQASFFDNSGFRIAQNSLVFSGVLLSDLQSMAGGTDIDGSSGKAFFELDASEANLFGLFAQSLGTFAAGQRLPAVSAVPTGTAAPEPVTIEFDARVNQDQFACDRTFGGIGTTDATVEPTDGRLYIENVRLVRADGGEAQVALDQDGTWQVQDTALLDFEDGTGLCEQRGTAATNTSVRGTVPGGTYERLRFEMGVTESLNHGDSATAPPPLDKTALFWSWNAGYKFIRYDNIVTSNGNEFRVHIGSTNCTGDGRGNATCGNSNRIEVDLPFDVTQDTVVVQLANFLANSDVTFNTPESPPGCMSAPDDPECVPVFAAAGLPYDGNPGGSQNIFFVE